MLFYQTLKFRNLLSADSEDCKTNTEFYQHFENNRFDEKVPGNGYTVA
jgi:hypothetical protein